MSNVGPAGGEFDYESYITYTVQPWRLAAWKALIHFIENLGNVYNVDELLKMGWKSKLTKLVPKIKALKPVSKLGVGGELIFLWLAIDSFVNNHPEEASEMARRFKNIPSGDLVTTSVGTAAFVTWLFNQFDYEFYPETQERASEWDWWNPIDYLTVGSTAIVETLLSPVRVSLAPETLFEPEPEPEYLTIPPELGIDPRKKVKWGSRAPHEHWAYPFPWWDRRVKGRRTIA